MIGDTLGSYSVIEKIGQGGMGEVYRATDSKLNRDVALKVLPEALALDGERLARFHREAQVLASLNHANIATIYGAEELGGRHALVMELVEGDTLDQRIARGPLAPKEAVGIALQIAEALETAHDKGIIHRDLKPANVKITPQGQVKLLDFGLAKALEAEPGSAAGPAAMTQSPTLTQNMTGAGVLLGTAAYMSPEQARGQAADRRADIWAFGVVLMEMLTGKMVYAGKTISDTLAGVLARQPQWEDLPATTPKRLRRLLERCLEKDVRERLQAIGEARIALEQYLESPTDAEESVEESTVAPLWKRLLPWAAAAALAVALVFALWLGPEGGPLGERVLRASIPPPEEIAFHLNPTNPGPAVVSPDGTKLAFTGRDQNGRVRLYVRALDASEASALSGTDGAQYPFWSPDSRWLGFFDGGEDKLKKIDVFGGPPQTLCDAADGKGGTWGPEGVILFAPSFDSPIHRVAAAGGESVAITELDTERGDDSHRHPVFLPGGRHFLYLARVNGGTDANSIVLASVDGKMEEQVLLTSPVAVRFASGHLLFVRDRTLMARSFDPDALEFRGEAFPLAEDVLAHPGAAIGVFSASENGVMAFQTGEAEVEGELEWLDRDGNQQGHLGDAALYRTPLISPTGAHAAVTIREEGSGTLDLWIYEIERDLRTRFTFDPGNEIWPVWSPDGETLFFAADPDAGVFDIYRKSIGGAGETELVYSSEVNKFPTSVSPDGKELVFFQPGAEGQAFDVWVLSLEGDPEPRPFRQSQFFDVLPAFSPDGRWMAFVSDESGTSQLYVTPYPGPGRKWQISGEGSSYYYWRPDGREIVYVQSDGQLMSVEVDPTSDSFVIGRSRPLFQQAAPEIGGPFFAPTPDFQRFLSAASQDQQASSLVRLVVNWTAEIPR